MKKKYPGKFHDILHGLLLDNLTNDLYAAEMLKNVPKPIELNYCRSHQSLACCELSKDFIDKCIFLKMREVEE